MPTTAPPSIGRRLRSARQQRGLSIEESAWRTRIRPDLLRALEREQFQALDHAAFVRRHLASYAKFLGLDPEDILRDFCSRYPPDEASPIEHLDRREKEAEKPRRPKWAIAAALSGLLLVAASVAGVVGNGPEPAPEPIDVPGRRIERAAAASRRLAAARVTLRVTADRSSRVTVLVDDQAVFDGVIAAGRSLSFAGRDDIAITAADGGAVRLSVNGVTLGVPGRSGHEYRARFGPNGALPS